MSVNININRNLITALYEGKLETVAEIVGAFGFPYSKAWPDGYVLLCNAVRKDHTEIAKLLIMNGSAVNNTHNISIHNGFTPLHYAANSGNEEITKLLLKHNAYINSRSDGRTSLHIAVERGYLHIAEDLLSHGADINSVCTSTRGNGFTSLHLSSMKGNEEIVKLLLSRNADCNIIAPNNITPLYIATENGHEAIVKRFLEHGVNINTQFIDCKTILHIAVEKKHVKIIEYILHANPDVDAKDKNGETPIFYAAANNDLKTANMLLKKGAKINIKQKDELTALHIAVKTGHVEITKFLLHHGAEVDCRDKESKTPLHIASKYGNRDIVKVLLKCGADIDLTDEGGNTALNLACKELRFFVVKTLLHCGADINIMARRNCSPLDFAWIKFFRLVEFLLSEMEDVVAITVTPCDVILLLKAHIYILRAADLYVNEHNLQFLSSPPPIFYSECKAEVERMRNEKISNHVSFYDIIKGGVIDLAKYARNKNIKQVLELGAHVGKFPIYVNMIDNNFKRGQRREKLLNFNLKSLNLLFGNNLPYLVAEVIFNYLNDKDLRNLLKACRHFR